MFLCCMVKGDNIWNNSRPKIFEYVTGVIIIVILISMIININIINNIKIINNIHIFNIIYIINFINIVIIQIRHLTKTTASVLDIHKHTNMSF